MGLKFRQGGWLIAASIVLMPVAALAAGQESKTPGAAEAILVAEIILLVLVGRVLGEAMHRIGQSAIVGQLLAGVILGPSVFGKLWPRAHDFIFPAAAGQKAMLTAIAQLGVLLLLLLTGMETDVKLVRRARGTAAAVSLTGIALPFACGFALGQFLPDSLLPAGHRLVSSLFLGTALSISSIKIVAAVVREMNFMRRNLGQVIVASAIIEDSVGWVIIAIILGIAQSGGVQGFSLLKTIGGVILFLIASFTLGQFVVFRIIRWVNDNFRSEFAVVTAILVIMGIMALITYGLGVQTVLGAFVAGVLIGESPILTEHIQNQLRGLVAALFMPVFFGQAGISADLSILAQPQLFGLTAVIVIIASVGKFSGAFAGGKFSGMSMRESLALGCGMNARGSTEVIVATIGLSMGALTQSLFTMIVTMAVVTTMAMPPMLRRALSRVPINSDEEARLEREELDARGFVGKLERMLVAIDDSPAGKFAAQLAGYLTGGKGMLSTVVKVEKEGGRRAPPAEAPAAPGEQIKESAAKAAAAMEETEEQAPRRVDVTMQPDTEPSASKQLAEMAGKGFDFLLIGIADTRAPDGAFSTKINELVNAFAGPLGILVPPEGGEPELGNSLLVPVTGTDVSRSGAEVAMALARAAGAGVSAIYVSSMQRHSPNGRARRNEEAVLKDIAELGRRYGVAPKTQIERHNLAEAPILKEAMKRHDLIVMGVNRRPGEALFFGNTAAALMSRWKGAIFFVAS